MREEGGALLIADDNEVNRIMLAQCFQQRGYTVTLARDGNQALDLLDHGSFDLVMLDITMPGTNGFAVLQALRRQHAATALPVIMATAHDRSDDIVRALDLGANDYVIKPYDFPVILARARTQLALKRMVEEQTRLEQSLAQRNEELAVANAKLRAAYERMKRDLQAAARIQEALLPQTLPRLPGVRFAWEFEPCEELAGDSLNVVPLDPSHVGLYLLDVSGHGVAAALLSVTLNQFLAPTPDPSSILVQHLEGLPGPRLVPPAEVADYLNRRFPWNPETEQYFTLVYGILDARGGEYRYVAAGHPGPIYLPPQGTPRLLETPGLPIGVGEAGYREHALPLEPGGRLWLYSDGLTDALSPAGEAFGKRRLLEAVAGSREYSLADSLKRVVGQVRQWCEAPRFKDDLSILAVEFSHGPGQERAPGV